MKKENFIDRFFFIIFLFLFINYSPLLRINMLHVIAFFSCFYLLLNYKYVKTYGLIGYVLSMLCMIGFVSSSILFGTNHYMSLLMFFEYLIDIIPSALVCVCYSNKYNIKKDDFLKIIFWVCFIQGILSLVTFIFPPFQMIFVYKAINYGFNAVKYSTFLGRRYFGTSYNLVTYLPVLQSLVSVILLEYSINKERKFFLLLPAIIFSALINSRSSLILLAIGFFIILFRKINLKRIVCMALGGTLLIMIFVFLFENLSVFSEKTYLWLNQGFIEIYNLLFNGKIEGYFTSLIDWQKKIPTGLYFLHGIGEGSVGGNSFGVASDIGYINYLWLGGINLFLLLHIFFFSIFIYFIKDKNEYIRMFGILAFVFTVIFNINMPIFFLNECTVLFIVFYFVIYNINQKQSFN